MALTPTKKDPSDKPSAEDEVIIREIDEAVRQDDTAQFVKKYGVVIGSVIGAGLLGLAGYLIWDAQTEAALEAESDALVSVLDYAQANDFASVQERVVPLLDSETSGVRTSARFLQAAAALERDEPTKAVELFAQIADDEGAPQALRDLARIREVATNFDEREPADIITALQDIAVPGNPLFGSAAELTAIAHIEAGNPEQAGTLFATIAKDEELPESLRSRSRQMAGLLGVDAIEDVEKLLEDEGVAPVEGDASATGAVGAATGPEQ
ncbi:MAG: tetratricopeptide repeat protein [Pseudomonadota bacterium]